MNPLLYLVPLVIIWLIATAYLYTKRQWLIYYLVGAFGFALFVVLFVMYGEFDIALASMELDHTVAVLDRLGLDGIFATGQQLFIPSAYGWAVLVCSIECSALLELSVIFSLVAFYVGFSLKRKIATALFGLAVTYVANIVRLMLITGITYQYGEQYIYLAHSVIARVAFFGFVLLIYWYLVTKPSIAIIGKKLIDEALARSRSEGGEQ
jgi:exosortase family protein XrtG